MAARRKAEAPVEEKLVDRIVDEMFQEPSYLDRFAFAVQQLTMAEEQGLLDEVADQLISATPRNEFTVFIWQRTSYNINTPEPDEQSGAMPRVDATVSIMQTVAEFRYIDSSWNVIAGLRPKFLA